MMVPYENEISYWADKATTTNEATTISAYYTLSNKYGTCILPKLDRGYIFVNEYASDWYTSVGMPDSLTYETTTTGDIYTRYAAVKWGTEYGFEGRLKSPADRLRDIIQSRQAPTIIGSRRSMRIAEDPREARARETLLRVLGEEKYRGFMRNGFVSVRGKSGKVYQIFPGSGMTKVYQNGQMIDRLCVVLEGSFPPTDSLIMRFLLILNDEAEFYRLAIKHSLYKSPTVVRQTDMRPLTEIYRGLVAA